MLSTARSASTRRSLLVSASPLIRCIGTPRGLTVASRTSRPSTKPTEVSCSRAQSALPASATSQFEPPPRTWTIPDANMAKDQYTEFTPELYPPFPEGLPTVELETLSLDQLLKGNADVQDRLFQVCKGRGFFYLDLQGSEVGDVILEGAQQIARVGEETFELPLDEKMKYTQGKGARTLFGYKYVGATVTDKAGTKDTAEFFNVAKNDMIVPDEKMKHEWPAPVLEAKPLFRSYISTAHSIGMLLLGILAQKLGVDAAAITSQHRIEEPAGDHVRITRGPPRKTEDMPEIQTPSHTDFGTITLLMNWLGGLQVWSDSARKAELNDGQPDSAGEWLWVKPQKGCAIINLGDAAVKFTNGVLCSGRHRVIPSPGAQGTWPRYSIVYFVRPEDKCVLKQLRGKGIPDGPEEEGLTAQEWIYRQAQGLGTKFEK
ncbi:hypothetical protein SUNI508_03882 [Seiridium unicorne]|uniref:Fe2OG dioxygenase domain-containing protein n=1 Tax=Seiridium unicorne TaxID=138068 RepID=A0ABR2VBE8_9PEZI